MLGVRDPERLRRVLRFGAEAGRLACGLVLAFAEQLHARAQRLEVVIAAVVAHRALRVDGGALRFAQLDDEQTVSDLALYPAANEGADLAVSVVGHEGEDLRVRLWLCPPAPRRAAPCDEPEPGVFPHVWLLFERPFFASRTSRWSAAFEGAYPDETGWSTSPTWRDEPALPWAPLPPLREPCDPRLGECLDPTRVDGCATWVPACRALGGDRTWPPEQSFCIDGVHDADDC